MSKLVELDLRIRAVENIERVTRTLATVAAAKLSRTRLRAAGLREYAGRCRMLLQHQHRSLAIASEHMPELRRLASPRLNPSRVALLVVSADRGMCGGYNLEILRVAQQFCDAQAVAGREPVLLAKGRKGMRYFARRGMTLSWQDTWERGGVSDESLEALLVHLMQLHASGTVDEVHAAYTEFHSPFSHEPRIRRLLPLDLDAAARSLPEPPRWATEPRFETFAMELVLATLRAELQALLLQSFASEQGARMVTMEEGTERAERTLEECRVLHNRMRREMITTDLLGALFAARAVAAAPLAQPGIRR